MNKKAIGPIIEKIIFIIIIIIFVSAMFLFINRVGNQNKLIGEIYCRQIALLIDNAKPGMLIELDISELYAIARKNKIPINSLINIDNQNKKVKVKLINSNHYEYSFFSDNPVLWTLKNSQEKLELEIK